jgi:hypothetical protein
VNKIKNFVEFPSKGTEICRIDQKIQCIHCRFSTSYTFISLQYVTVKYSPVIPLYFKTNTTANVCSEVLNHAALETNSFTLQTRQQFTMRTTKDSSTGRYAKSRSRACFIMLKYTYMCMYVCILSVPLWLQISLVNYHFLVISMYRCAFLLPWNEKFEDVEMQPTCMKFSGLDLP